eukprot:8523407-Pyramimonas_sp.AAC.2
MDQSNAGSAGIFSQWTNRCPTTGPRYPAGARGGGGSRGGRAEASGHGLYHRNQERGKPLTNRSSKGSIRPGV